MTAPHVVLVDGHDREIGVEEKVRAHVLGLLHRAVSAFVFNTAGELLLQRRAARKYHCGGAWSNTACGHPQSGESPITAASRRLRQEMGIDCPLHSAGAFLYRLPVGQGLIEHEYDHLFWGQSDETPAPDPHEVEDWRWMPLHTLAHDLRRHPTHYSPWLPTAFAQLCRQRAFPIGAGGRSGSVHF